jgi:NADH-quinone oxidoreductase subunit L
MAFVLVLLALGSVLAGYVGVPHAFGGSNRIEQFLEPSFTAGGEARAADHEESASATESLEWELAGVSIVVALAGIGLATYFFLKNRRAADSVSARFAGLHRLLEHKYYVDEIYDAAVVRPIRIVSEAGLWKGVDVRVIDGSVNGVGEAVDLGGQLLRRAQTGSVRVYAASLFLGVVLILGYYLWT